MKKAIAETESQTPPTPPVDDTVLVVEKTPAQLLADRLYEAVSHLRKGGTLTSETIDDLLKFIKPEIETPTEHAALVAKAAELTEKRSLDEARKSLDEARDLQKKDPAPTPPVDNASGLAVPVA